MAQVATIQSPAVLQWVRAPQQERTRAGLTRILDAAEELLAEKSFDEISIAEIAKHAGSSVGAFYRRFRDKEGLLHALHARFSADARATTDVALEPTRWAGASLENIVYAFTSFLVQIHRERDGLFSAFMQRSSCDAAMRESTEELLEYICGRLNDLLIDHREHISHPDPSLAAALGLHVVIGALTNPVRIPVAELVDDDEGLAGELGRLFTAYLGVV